MVTNNKQKISLLFFILIFFLISCTDSRAPSGIDGKILYGEGDCTSPLNENNRNYELYTGRVWVINKSVIDTMNMILFDSTNSDMLTTMAVNGMFSLLVPPGTYYIIADTLFYISSENIITLEPDDLIVKEFRFYKCI